MLHLKKEIYGNRQEIVNAKVGDSTLFRQTVLWNPVPFPTRRKEVHCLENCLVNLLKPHQSNSKHYYKSSQQPHLEQRYKDHVRFNFFLYILLPTTAARLEVD